ncbi:hypothetical protein [Burkholderia sp. Ac-20365]|uniref:hypothetical protein n=1 Tax=Burkholderia sp. Ac-20365 TaxID=2703897 RepID=UPI00197BB560|nr:hypothetical protein [Burkholderia sp. Ac-20365]MBN3760903.1 hypothetical protein [Burkholderia sp. Ac-20365]
MIKPILSMVSASALIFGATAAVGQTATDPGVARYIQEKYGAGNDLSLAASVYANSLIKLWDKTAVEQKYSSDLTLAAGLGEMCLMAKLSRVDPAGAQDDLAELRKTVASTPVRYAGYAIAGHLADLYFAPPPPMSEAQVCGILKIPAPAD